MKPVKFSTNLTVRISTTQRKIIDGLAQNQELSIGEAARLLLDAGASALGIEVENQKRMV